MPDLLDDILAGKVAKPAQPKQQKGSFTSEEVDEFINSEHSGSVKALFDTVKKAEGGEPDIIVGGKLRFDPNGDHPNQVGLTTSAGPSTAAGNYQITGTNWYGAKGQPGLKARLGAKNFDENQQYRAAVMLANDAKADRSGKLLRGRGEFAEAVRSGNLDRAREILAQDWTSTPGSTIGGGGQKKLSEWQKTLDENLGVQKARTSQLDEILFGGGNEPQNNDSRNLDEILSAENNQPVDSAPSAENSDILTNLRQQKTQLESDLKKSTRVRDQRQIKQAIKTLDASIVQQTKDLPQTGQRWQFPQTAAPGGDVGKPAINPPSPTFPNQGLPERIKYEDGEIVRENENVFVRADGTRFEVAETSEGYSRKELNPKLILGEGDGQLTQTADQQNVPTGKVRVAGKNGDSYLATAKEDQKSFDLELERSAPAPITEKDYKAYFAETKQTDTPENRKAFEELVKNADAENFGKRGEVKSARITNVSGANGKPIRTQQSIVNNQQPNTTAVDAAQPPASGEISRSGVVRLPNEAANQKILKTNDDIFAAQAGRFEVDVSLAPAGMDKNEFIQRAGLSAFGLNDEQINRVINYKRAKNIPLLKRDATNFEGIARTAVPYGDLIIAYGGDADNIPAEVSAMVRETQADADLKLYTSENTLGKNEFGDEIRARDMANAQNAKVVREREGLEFLQNRTGDADYAAQQRAAEKLQDGQWFKDALISAASPLAALYVGAKNVNEAWDNLGKDVEPPSKEWVDGELSRLKKQYGSYASAADAEKYYQNTDLAENFVRVSTQVARSFAKNAVSGTIKGTVFLGDLLEDANPLNIVLPDEYKIGLRNAGNVMDFAIRLLSAPSSAQAVKDMDWVSGDAPISEQQIFRAMQEFDKTIGDDKVLKGRFLGSLADAGGSALSFVALGMLTPQLSVGKFLGGFNVGSAALGGLQSAGSGYEEGINAGLGENGAKTFGVISGMLGLTEGFGIGNLLGDSIDNPIIRRNLALAILDVAKKAPNKIYREGKEEFIQEVFLQSAPGKAALEYLKDKDASAYNKIVNALNRLPKQLAETAANEGLIAILTGGTLGGVTSVAGSRFEDAPDISPAPAVPNISVPPADLANVNETTQNVQTDDASKAINFKTDIASKLPNHMANHPDTKDWITQVNNVVNAGLLKLDSQLEPNIAQEIVEKTKNVYRALDPDLLSDFSQAESQISDIIGKRFYAHGAGRQNSIESLIEILSNGLESGRNLNEETIGSKFTNTGGSGYRATGDYVLIGKPDTSISEGGIQTVVLNRASEILKPVLQKNFPDVDFLTVDEFTSDYLKDKLKNKQSDRAVVTENVLKPEAAVEFTSRETGEIVSGKVKKIRGKKVSVEVAGSDAPVMVKADQLTLVPAEETADAESPQNETEKRATAENTARISDIKGQKGKAQPFDFGKIENPNTADQKLILQQRESAVESVNEWQRKNKTNWQTELFASGVAESNAAFDAAAAEGADLQAHGMAKASPSEAIKNLFSLFENGLDQNRGRKGKNGKATLDTANLTKEKGASNGGMTASGTAYRDGAFILLAKPGVVGISSMDEVAAVLVNPALNGSTAQIQAALPNVLVTSYQNVGEAIKRAKELNSANGKSANIVSTDTVSTDEVNSLRTVKVNGLEIALSPKQNERWTKEIEPLAIKNKERFEQAMTEAALAEKSGDLVRAGVIRDEANSAARRDAMKLSALKREVADVLTVKEQAKKLKREKSNFPGKLVSVDGRNATVVGAPYGNVTITFNDDGTRTTVSKTKIAAPVAASPINNSDETSTKDDLSSTSSAKIEKAAEKKPEYRFSSTQANLTGAMRDKILALGKTLTDDADLAEDGREQQPHVTVKFGLHTQKADDIKKIVGQIAPFEVTLGKVSHFKGKKDADYDVLKVEIVDSPELHALNKLIGENAKNTETFPVYKPHITLAYVKKGLGAKYAGSEKLAGTKIQFDELYFSDKKGAQTPIKLNGKSSAISSPLQSDDEQTPDERTEKEKQRDAKINKIASGKPRSAPGGDPTKHSLSQYIRMSGGIRPSGGIDLAAIENAESRTRKGKKKSGFASLIRPGGKDIEDVFRDALESGYLTGIAQGYKQSENFDRSGFTADDFVEAVADDLRGAKYFSIESEKYDEKSIEDAQTEYNAKKAEQEKSQAGLADLTDEEFYAQKTIEDFLADDEVRQILLQSEKSGKISDKDRSELLQIGHYEKGLEKQDVENTITELERAFGTRQNALETAADTQPGIDRNSQTDSDQSRQAETSRIYQPEPTEQIDEPEDIISRMVDAMTASRTGDDFVRKFAGEYFNEYSKNEISAALGLPETFLKDEAEKAIKEFYYNARKIYREQQEIKQSAAERAINSEKLNDKINAATGVTDSINVEQDYRAFSEVEDEREFTIRLLKESAQIDESEPDGDVDDSFDFTDDEPAPAAVQPQQSSFDQTDLFGNKVSAKTEQTDLFDTSALESERDAAIKKETSQAYGKKTADYLFQLEKSSDPDIRRVAGGLIFNRNAVNSKGENAKALVEDAADALDLFLLAKQQKNSIREQLSQGRLDAESYNDRAAEFARFMMAGKFAVKFDEVLSEVKKSNTKKTAEDNLPLDYGTIDQPNAKNLARKFADHFKSGKGFSSIVEARKFAGNLLGGRVIGGTASEKQIQEIIELGIVLRATEISAEEKDAGKAFDQLVELYNLQPNLSGRTSTSIAQQAYSTPAPLAYLASKLAGINKTTSVYEPTAGNGMLLMDANPNIVTANELNEDRFNRLKDALPGATLTKGDALENQPEGKFDVIITNPPFGSVKDAQGNSKTFQISAQYKTFEIDHAIALKALETMKDDGRAVLIIGSVMPRSEQSRSDAYNGKSKRAFFYSLLNAYNVTNIFTADGGLYARQGAGFPVDVIVIEGRGKSKLEMPAATVPKIYNSWSDLKGVLDEQSANGSVDADGRTVVFDAESGSVSDGDGDQLEAGTTFGQRRVLGAADAAGAKFDNESRRSDLRDERNFSSTSSNESGTGTADESRNGSRKTDSLQLESANTSQTSGSNQKSSGGNAKQSRSGENNRGDGLGKLDQRDNDSTDGQQLVSKADGDAAIDAAFDQLFGSEPQTEQNLTATSAENTTETTNNAPANLDEAAELLRVLLGGDETLKMARISEETEDQDFDAETYEKMKPAFTAAYDHFKAKISDLQSIALELLKTLHTKYNFTREQLAKLRPFLSKFVVDTTNAAADSQLKITERNAPTVKTEDKAVENDLQVTYQPKSGVKSENVLVPVNMQLPIRQALDALETEVGDVDEYVAGKLNLKASEIGNYFNAEQMDALGLALFNIEGGKGFIIGDQTGLGKGRVVAGILKYAMLNGKTPIFVTEKPNLYKDIYRDLQDIGVSEPRLLMTNSGETVYLNDAETVSIRNADAKAHAALLQEIADAGELSEHDLVVTTYNQMQTVKGNRTVRHDVLEALAPNSIIVFDESHNAGGTEGSGKQSAPGLNRADFARRLARLSTGVMFSSATYAKRPEVMSLYASTDIHLAVSDISKLPDIINEGGVPLQQTVAAMLSEAGQYIRRERSFDGIEYNLRSIKVDKTVAEGISSAMRLIQSFDALKQIALTKIDKELKREGKKVSGDGSTGGAGASSTNFTSIMHNLIDQMLVTTKVNETADVVIEAYLRGEKPVVTLANTMGSFIETYADEYDLKTGDAIDLDFGNLLLRYLERSREVREKNAYGQSSKRMLSDEELGPRGVEFFNRTKDAITAMDWSKVPVSPIDYLHNRLHNANIRTGEVTGRSQTIDYSGDTPTYKIRPAAQIKPTGRNRTITGFNNGSIDVLILNQAGSTGLSAHASSKFVDRRQRHMFILQAEKNIDTHMQMLGRINRTGQIDGTDPSLFSAPELRPAEVYGKPRYTQLIADIPAEVRPAAVLSQKMASLNANTTGSKDSKVSSSEIFDFMNEYGDTVIADLMYQNPEIHAKLGEPLKYNDSGNGFEEEAAARKTTGRIPLLKISEQEEVYQRIQDAYSEYVQQLDALGENALEAKTMDLDAKTVASKEIFPKSGESPFQQSAQAETVDIRRQGKPFTKEQILTRLSQELEKDLSNVTAASYAGEVMQAGADKMGIEIRLANNEFIRYRDEILDETPEDRLDGERAKLNGQSATFQSRIIQLPIGAKVQIDSKNFGSMHGVVLEIKRGSRTKNPLALGDWKITFALADNLRQLTLPLSKLAFGNSFNNQIARDEAIAQGAVVFSRASSVYDNLGNRTDILDAFDNAQGSTRETRTMITGNLLAGFGIAKKGQFVYYTDADGNNRQGVLMPKNFNIEKTLKDAPVLFPTIQNAIDFIKAQSSNLLASTTDGAATATQSFGKFSIGVPAPRTTGGKYFLNPQILAVAGQDFAKSGSRMLLRDLDEQTAYRVMEAIADAGDVNWQTNSYKDVAARIVGANQNDGSGETLKKSRTTEIETAISEIEGANLTELLRVVDPVAGLTSDGHLVDVKNVETFEILRRAVEAYDLEMNPNKKDRSRFDGLFLNPAQLSGVIKILRRGADFGSRESGLELSDRRKLHTIADTLKTAAKIDGTVIVKIFDDAIPHEETHHVSFVESADKKLSERHGENLDNLFNHETIKKLLSGAFSRLLPKRASKAYIVEEANAWLLGGGREKLNEIQRQMNLPEITKAEAADFLADWQLSYHNANPSADMKKFAAISEYASEIYEQARRIEKTARSRSQNYRKDSGANAARQGNAQKADARTSGQSGIEKSAAVASEKSEQTSEQINAGETSPKNSSKTAIPEFVPSGDEKISNTPISARSASIPLADRIYTSVTNDAQIAYSDDVLDKGLDKATDWFNQAVSLNDHHHGATTAIGLNLMQQYGDAGDIDAMNKVADALVPYLTEAGQAIQAVAILSMHDPKTAGTYAAKVKKQKTGKDITTEEYDKAIKIAEQLQERAKIDGAAKAALEQAQSKLKDLEAEQKELERAAQIAGDKNEKLNLKLQDARKEIASAKAKIKRLEESRPAKMRAVAHGKLLTDLKSRENQILANLRAKFGAGEILKMARAADSSAAPSDDLLDWATLVLLQNLPTGTMNVGEFKNALNQITGGQLSIAEIDDIHAAAIDRIKQSKPPAGDAKKAVAKNRSEHYAEAEKHERRYENAVKTILRNLAKQLKKDEKNNRTDAYTTALITVWAQGEYADADIFLALAAKTKLSEAEIAELKKQKFTDEQIGELNTRKTPDEAIGLLKAEFPDLTAAEIRRAIIAADEITQKAKEKIESDRIQKANEYDLTTEAVERIRQEKKFNQRQSQKTAGQAARFYAGLAQTDTQIAAEATINLRRAGLLTGIKTHLRNFVSNTMFEISEEFARPVQALADIAADALTGAGRTAQGISPSGIGNGFKNLFTADETLKNLELESGLKEAYSIMVNGDTSEHLAKLQLTESHLADKIGRVGAIADGYINFVFRTMGAEDALFKVYAFRRSLEEQAQTLAKTEAKTNSEIDVETRRKQLITNPTNVMQMQARNFADEMTFQNDNKISDLVNKVRNYNTATKTTLGIIAPFDRTPTNIILRILEHSPLGFIKAANDVRNLRNPTETRVRAFNNKYRVAVQEDAKTRKDFKEKSATEKREIVDEALKTLFTREQQRAFAKTFGRATIGSAGIAFGFLLAAAGLLAGVMEPDEDDKEETDEFFARRKAGIENRSLRIPKIGRFIIPDDPWMRSLTLGATIYEQAALAEKQRKDVVLSTVAVSDSFSEIALNQPLIDSAGSYWSKIKKGKYGEIGGSLAGSFVPTIIADAGDAGDEKARTGSSYVEGEKINTTGDWLKKQGRGFANSASKRVPVLRNYVGAEDTGGVSQEERGGVLRRLVRMVDIFNTRSDVAYAPGTLPTGKSSKNELINRLDTGKISAADAKQEIKEKIKSGELTTKQGAALKKTISLTPIERTAFNLDAADEIDFVKIEEFSKTVKPEEKEKIYKIFWNKYQNKLEGTQDAATIKQARRLKEIIEKNFAAERKAAIDRATAR